MLKWFCHIVVTKGLGLSLHQVFLYDKTVKLFSRMFAEFMFNITYNM